MGTDTMALRTGQQAEAEHGKGDRFFALLTAITRAALASEDLTSLTQILADRLGELFDADGCYITLWDEATGTPVPAAAYGEWRGRYRDLSTRPEDITITASVLDAGRPLAVPEMHDTPYLSPRIAADFPDASLLGLPLLAGSRRLGAALIAYRRPHQFTPLEIARGEQVAGLISLALDKARLVDELSARTAALEARNAELDTFAHTVAHDLKEPLGWIVGYAEMLGLGYSGLTPEERQRHLEIIAESGRKMSHIIDELLFFCSLRGADAAPRMPLNMAWIVDEALVRLAGMVRERGAEITLPDAWPTAIGYAPWVEEVWANYLSNAIKYGGRPPRLVLGAAPCDDGQIRFWVQDNGDGISPEQRDELFEPRPHAASAAEDGHGLGLSIARRIVLRLGGQVAVESRPGAGSRFSFTLPAASEGFPDVTPRGDIMERADER